MTISTAIHKINSIGDGLSDDGNMREVSWDELMRNIEEEMSKEEWRNLDFSFMY